MYNYRPWSPPQGIKISLKKYLLGCLSEEAFNLNGRQLKIAFGDEYQEMSNAHVVTHRLKISSH